MPRIKLVIEYDGSQYHGMQRQDNAPTVQAELEKQIHRLTGETISILAAGRTDAGVHALGQVIAFNTASSIPPDRWSLALNSFLPEDIRVLSSRLVSPVFHPQFHAASKCYAYRLYRQQTGAVFYRRYALCTAEPLNIGLMRQACQSIQGRHNFQSFCASGSGAKTFERAVSACRLQEMGALWQLEIEADGFLYNMVRIIMGTLLEVGRERIPAEAMKTIIQSRNRSLAGPTAPGHGLYLVRVCYPPEAYTSENLD
jgi:tRNA pseudouridine38-40 synthase